MKTVKAAQRLLAERASIDTPKFRYLDDAVRVLERMESETRDSDALIRVQQSLLAYLLRPRNRIEATLSKKIDPAIKKTVIPSFKKLEDHYGLCEELHDRLRLLDAIESQISVQFPDRQGRVYDEAISLLRTLKKKTDDQLKTVLDFLGNIAEKHIPKAFDRFRQAVAQELQEHFTFLGSEQLLYVSIENEQLVFTNYFLLRQARHENRVIPQLYISLQWIVGQAVYVDLNHEFELPAQLYVNPGVATQTLIEAVQAVENLLNEEGFSSPLGSPN
jgi:hypothetical protein